MLEKVILTGFLALYRPGYVSQLGVAAVISLILRSDSGEEGQLVIAFPETRRCRTPGAYAYAPAPV